MSSDRAMANNYKFMEVRILQAFVPKFIEAFEDLLDLLHGQLRETLPANIHKLVVSYERVLWSSNSGVDALILSLSYSSF